MKCLCVRHVHFEDLGSFAPVFSEAGFSLDMRNVGLDAIDESAAREADLLVLLGAPLGVYDTKTHPYLADEIGWAEQRLKSGRPILGVCLGAQIMAAASGARVYPGTEKEIGWKTVTINEQVADNLLLPLRAAPVFHWHGDNMDLPAGAECLASTPACPVQAFRIGNFALALQFHLELDPSRIEPWLIGHWAELHAAGIEPAAIRRDTQQFGAKLVEVAPRILRPWMREAFGR